MTTKNRVLPALLLSLFASVAPDAQAQTFSNVIVFGDSLSDAGYYRGFLAARGLPANLVATMGRFTTNPGPVWSELLVQHYGFTPGPSNAGGTIYAQGGARVALTPGITPPGQSERPVSTQITEYLTASGGGADPNALFSVWAGANDFFIQNAALTAGQITPAQLQANVLGAATAEIQQVGRLFAAGAQHVIVVGGFDGSFTPAVAALDPATRTGVTALTAGYNTTLWSGFATAGLRVIPVDLFSFVNEIRANPSAYGFSNITGVACGPFPPVTTSANALFCYTGNLVSANAAQTYFFADATGHMTTAANALVAQFAESLIDGPMQYSLLAEAPLASRRIHIRSLVDSLTHALRGEPGKLNVFVTADNGNLTIDSNSNNSGVDGRNKGYNVGVSARVTEAVVLGAAIGQREYDGSFGGGMGGFNTREQVLSLLASMRLGGFWGNGVVSISNIDFRDVQRNIVLGPTVRTAGASTDGSNASAYFSAGYDFALGRFMVGPMIAVTTQNVEVNAFSEDGAGAANLRISSQTRRSEVWSAGLRAYLTGHAWLPWIRVTADQERRDDARFVTASPLSLPTGNSYDVPAYMPDKNSTTAAVGVHGMIGDHVGLSLSYYKVFGRSGVKEDGINGAVSYRF